MFGRRGWKLPTTLLAVGALLVLWPGWQGYLWMRGPVLDVAWQAVPDRPATVRAVGAWAVGEDAETVVRARGDALIAYDSRAGDRRWVLRAPVRKSVCGMSDTVVDGIGLVAFSRHDKPCDTVWGVGVRDGRKVWERELDGVSAFSSASDGLLAADGDTAVALADDAVRGFGLADGTPRWTTRLTEPKSVEPADDEVECRPKVGSAAGGTTRVVVQCDTFLDFRSAWLVTLDNATGKETARQRLPVESPVVGAMVVAAEPFTLLLTEEDDRGVAAVLSFAGDGDPVRIPLTADQEDLVIDTAAYPKGFLARPALTAVVRDEVLVVAATEPGGDSPERIVAHSLRDGRRMWHADLGIPVVALAPDGDGELAVLGANQRLWTIGVADGAWRGESDGTTIREAGGLIETCAQLLRAGDTWVAVNPNGVHHPPLLAFRP
ncbi:outer membrane protein assembly factor BamB family protein [Streptomyces sp. NPDC001595]|uniref:outer membrane protein assembly factor BamB family protein n=1 Tax=Streptomyces sp. NPDC001532 TaxID=3154520 RepID=UPI00332587AD